MDRTEDLLGISSPLYYRLILIEGRVKSNLIEVYHRSLCDKRRFEISQMDLGDLEWSPSKNLNP
jgi:hypothetical protein